MTVDHANQLMDQLEARWRDAHVRAQSIRRQLDELPDGVDLAHRDDLQGRLEQAETAKRKIMREIEAVEDALLETA